jgi:hypothetical protein
VSAIARVARYAVALCCALAFIAGCEMTGTTAPSLETRAVVHAVLNPTSNQQIIIVERTQRSLPIGGPTRDPIHDARVVILGPREDSAVAVPDPVNPGIYRLASVTEMGLPGPNVLFLRPGDRYRLRVETPFGVVTGETTVPVGGTIDGGQEQFNVDRDTLTLTGQAQFAGGYLLRHETSTDARERYVTSIDGPLLFPLAQARDAADDEQWAFEWVRESIRPGHSQSFAVIAVDSNYFRYYVAGFDPFGDDTRGNTLVGGVGLFGAVSPMMVKTLDLIADIDSLGEGIWQADRPSLTLPATLRLYSSPYFPGTTFGGTPVSGRGVTSAQRILEAIGVIDGTVVQLQLTDISGAVPTVSATGLLGVDFLVLNDTRSQERVTYRRR